MMTEEQKKFIKINKKVLSDIFSDKITALVQFVLDESTDRDKNIEVINILRNWLREIEIIEKGGEIKGNTFV